MSQRILVGVLLFLCVFSAAAFAQEARGSIVGLVTDPQGAAVPNATVTLVNQATNGVRRTTSNETGYYEANYLEPSLYTVTVEVHGFKKAIRTGLELTVGTRLEINMKLEIGGVAEVVEVKGEAPLLETSTATGGRVLDHKQLTELPFGDQNPFTLVALAPGMQWTGQPEYRRPFDNGGTSSFNTAGNVGGVNEYSIDGATVTGTGRRVGFVPPAGAVGEFKIETANFDASQGFTAGAAINVLSKSGTNRFSGHVLDQHWQQRWNATGHFTRLQWEDQVAKGKISSSTPKQASGRSNNYEASASGPVWIPKIYNGKDKFFWTFTYNGIKQAKAETTSSINRTVPKMAWRNGDFSDMLSVPNGATLFQLYDPRSAVLGSDNVVRRMPFAGNKGIPKLNPMYDFYTKLYPAPNNVPGLATVEGFNNYLAAQMPKNENFYSMVNRYDYVISDKHRVNARWQYNNRLADEYDWTYETARGLHTNGLTRINPGGNVGWLWTISSTNILDVGFSISRFREGSQKSVPLKYGPKDVGLPAYMDQRAGSLHILPRLDFNDIEDVSSGYPAIDTNFTAQELRAAMTTIKGNHSFRYGTQIRRTYFGGNSPGYTSGSFNWRNPWTRAANNTNTASNHVHDWASFMMGVYNGDSIDTNDNYYLQMPRQAFYFQDDWRVNRRWTLTLGLRFEHESGEKEKFNRAIAGPFLPDLVLPITAGAEAAYAANPIPEMPAAQFKVRGGTAYLGQQGFSTYTKGSRVFMPKVGVVFRVNDDTVIRAGYGAYADTLNINSDRPNNYGFAQPTGTPASTDNGVTFCCGVGAAANLASGRTMIQDPFPVRADGTRFDEPLRNYLGAMAFVGRGTSGAAPWDFKPAVQHRWRIGVQRQWTRHNMLFDVSYTGSYANIPVGMRTDYLPAKYWTTGMVRNQANDDFLNANFKNPFNISNFAAIKTSDPKLYNWMAGQGFFTGNNRSRNSLLRAYPQMTGINYRASRVGSNTKGDYGYNRYKDMQVLVERRFAKGFTSSVMYTYAKGVVADWMANEFDPLPTERINNATLPHRLAWSGLYELPFGKNRQFVKAGPLSYLIGNWNVSWVYQRQSGPVPDWGNRFFYGDINKIGDLWKHDEVNGKDLHVWFDPSLTYRQSGAIPSGFTGFDGRTAAQPGSYHVRVFPSRIESLRSDGIRNWDVKIKRIFPIWETVSAQFDLDLLNATNHTNFSGPNLDPTSSNFGRVNNQRGMSRVLQFNLRVVF